MVWIVRLFAFFRFARKQFNVPGLEIWLGSVDIDLFARHLCPLVFFPWPPCLCFDALRFDVLYIIQTPALKIFYKRFSCVKDFFGTWCLVACVNVQLEETLFILCRSFCWLLFCWIVLDCVGFLLILIHYFCSITCGLITDNVLHSCMRYYVV